MTWMIGIDEAGYGPNLGPLVVAATAWRVSEEGSEVRGQGSGKKKPPKSASATPPNAPPVDLYARLANIVSKKPTEGRIAIADSKLLYKPRGGLQLLERGVLTGLGTVGRNSVGPIDDIDALARWQTFWDATLADPEGHRRRLPWYADYDCPLPINADLDELVDLQKKFQSVCSEANIELVDLRARAVFPREFNDLTEHYGTKGAALSHVSIGLLREVIDRLSGALADDSTLPSTRTDCIHVTCDKHGGRNRYAELLQHHFPEDPIKILLESRPASRYQWGPSERRIEVCFRTKGEEELPAALASMTAKYHRELAMRAFNAFWAEKVSGLKPTAGYPVDAKRFKAQIAVIQKKLGIDDHDLWRNR